MIPTKCRSCGAQVAWVTMAKSGKKAPVDFDPTLIGNIRIGDKDVAEVIPKYAVVTARDAGEALYISHFATCPGSASHRKPR